MAENPAGNMLCVPGQAKGVRSQVHLEELRTQSTIR